MTSPPPRAVTDRRSRVQVLADTVGFALQALADPLDLHPAVGSGRLDAMLRAALTGHPTDAPDPPRADAGDAVVAEEATVAVRVACAYLAAGDLRETHQALLTAQNILPRRQIRPPLTLISHHSPDAGHGPDHDGDDRTPRGRSVS